jgi:hypothetical protein
VDPKTFNLRGIGVVWKSHLLASSWYVADFFSGNEPGYYDVHVAEDIFISSKKEEGPTYEEEL